MLLWVKARQSSRYRRDHQIVERANEGDHLGLPVAKFDQAGIRIDFWNVERSHVVSGNPPRRVPKPIVGELRAIGSAPRAWLIGSVVEELRPRSRTFLIGWTAY
jgi:hypothetical protein